MLRSIRRLLDKTISSPLAMAPETTARITRNVLTPENASTTVKTAMAPAGCRS
jgi:hypothetical protein